MTHTSSIFISQYHGIFASKFEQSPTQTVTISPPPVPNTSHLTPSIYLLWFTGYILIPLFPLIMLGIFKVALNTTVNLKSLIHGDLYFYSMTLGGATLASLVIKNGFVIVDNFIMQLYIIALVILVAISYSFIVIFSLERVKKKIKGFDNVRVIIAIQLAVTGFTLLFSFLIFYTMNGNM